MTRRYRVASVKPDQGTQQVRLPHGISTVGHVSSAIVELQPIDGVDQESHSLLLIKAPGSWFKEGSEIEISDGNPE